MSNPQNSTSTPSEARKPVPLPGIITERRRPVRLPGIFPAPLERMHYALDLLAGIGIQVCWLADTCWAVLDRDESERESTLTDDLEQVLDSALSVCEHAEELRDVVDDMLLDVVDDMESRSAQHTAE